MELQELNQNSYIAFAQIIQMILNEHMGILAVLILCLIFREPIAELILKLWKLTFKSPEGSEFSLETTHQNNSINDNTNISSADAVENVNNEDDLLENVEDDLGENEVDVEGNGEYISIGRLFSELYHKKSNEADAVYAKLIAKSESNDELISIKSVYYYGKYIYLKEHENLEKLLGLLEECENDEQYLRVLSWMANLYEDIKEFDKAITKNTEYVKHFKEEKSITRLYIRIANTYKRKGDYIGGIDLIKERLTQVKEDDSIALCYKGLGELYKENKEEESAAICYEKYIEYRSDDDDEIFNAAYAQANSDMYLLSLINYEKVCSLDSDNMTAINNLGVTFGELKLHGNKFSKYKKAADKGETLSMANIAYMYIESGLYDDADAIIKKGRMSENPHKNIGAAMGALAKTIEKEEEKINEYRIRADKFRNEIRKYTYSRYQESGTTQDFEGVWVTEENDKLIAKCEGSNISAEWSSLAPVGLLRAAQGAKPEVYEHTLSGEFINSSATLTITKKKVGGGAAAGILFGSSDESQKCRSYLANNKQEWIMFKINKDEEFMFKLRRFNSE